MSSTVAYIGATQPPNNMQTGQEDPSCHSQANLAPLKPIGTPVLIFFSTIDQLSVLEKGVTSELSSEGRIGVHLEFEVLGNVNHSRRIAHTCRLSGGQELVWLQPLEERTKRHKMQQVREVGARVVIAFEP